MMLWIIIAGMTALMALAVLWPLSRPQSSAVVGNAENTGIYQAQIAEIERDAARGLLGVSEAEALRVEAARRLLRAGQEAAPAITTERAALMRRRIAALLIIIALPFGALFTYLSLGSPQLPDQPLAARLQAAPDKLDVQQALVRIEQHLAKNPTDLRGWDLIAPIYLRMGRVDDAIRAYQTAINNGGANAERWAALGEARMMAADGMITAEARSALDEALKLSPGYPKAVYGLAMAKQQDGDVAGAIADIEKLISSAPAEAPYLPLLRQSLATLQAGPGATKADAAKPDAQTEAGEAIAKLPSEERNDAIRGMVEGLSERLKTGGGTLEEWQRLIRARTVLGDKPAAEAALALAQKRLGHDAAALAAIQSLAQELGIRGLKLEPKP